MNFEDRSGRDPPHLLLGVVVAVRDGIGLEEIEWSGRDFRDKCLGIDLIADRVADIVSDNLCALIHSSGQNLKNALMLVRTRDDVQVST